MQLGYGDAGVSTGTTRCHVRLILGAYTHVGPDEQVAAIRTPPGPQVPKIKRPVEAT